VSEQRRSTLLNLTTATKDNALSVEERNAFLERKLVGRLATNRRDGWWHVTPIWYLWERERFLLSLGKSRRHLANMREDDHVTLCVDVDRRPEGVMEGPVAVVCFGRAELIEDAQQVREITDRLVLRYLGSIPPEFEEAAWFEGRTAVAITPVRWLAWDQGKR
jgi:PPOX class probable F420-dependent enzyme